jgi:hypothetical protein
MLTFTELKLHAAHACAIDSTTLPPGTTADAAAGQIVNTAGRAMYKHAWNFRIAPPAPCAFLAPITISNGTWTAATKTITKTSGFASYTFAKGDLWKQEDGTGATDGLYTIASKTSDNAIVLARDTGATDASADIDGQIQFPYVTLPSDFAELVDLSMNSSTADIELTSLGEVMACRLRNITTNANRYRAAVLSAGRTTATAATAAPRLELDHAPTAADPDAVFVVYRRAWLTLSGSTDIPNEMPEYAEDLLIEFIRAYAEGYMVRHGENGFQFQIVDTTDRVQQIKRGDIWKDTVSQDGLLQSDYGSTGQGPAGHPMNTHSWRSRTSGAVADPS